MNKKLTALAVFGAALVLTSAGVAAKKFYETEFVYMNSKGEVVGERTYHCAGGSSGWGIQTAIYTKTTSPCQ